MRIFGRVREHAWGLLDSGDAAGCGSCMFARSAMLLPGSPAAPACCSALYLHDMHADFLS